VPDGERIGRGKRIKERFGPAISGRQCESMYGVAEKFINIATKRALCGVGGEGKVARRGGKREF